MKEGISTIKQIELKNDFIESKILFGQHLGGSDLKFLEDEFDFYNEDINKFVANYKNVGLVFRLIPNEGELRRDWKEFIQRVVKKSYDFDKFNNVFANKDFDKILLVTNKRLLKVDLEKLNEKIERVNYRIASYDEKVENEMEDLAEATKEGGLFHRISELLKR